MLLKKSILTVVLLVFITTIVMAQAELIALGILGVVSLLKNNSQKNIMIKNNRYNSYLKDANDALTNEKFNEAIRLYGEAIKLEPEVSHAYSLRGALYSKFPEYYDNAIADLSKSISLNNNDEDAYLNLGVIYFFKSDFDKAIFNYNKAIQLNENNGRAYFYRGNVAYNLKMYDEALSYYKIALDKNFDDPILLYNKANVYIEKMEDEKALGAYKQAIVKGLKVTQNIYKDQLKGAEKFIQSRVEAFINQWQQKGEFEKTTDYKNRVNEDTRNKKAKTLSIKYKEDWQKIFITLFLQNNKEYKIIDKYDADNETFLVSHPFIGQVPIKVLLDEALFFKNNFNNLYFHDFDIIPVQDSIVVAKFLISEKQRDVDFALSIMDKLSTKKHQFVYDNKQALVYASTNIQYNFMPINYDANGVNVHVVNNFKIENKNILLGRDAVDTQIPENNFTNEHTYAVIIGNEDYSSFQTGLSNEINVDFAINDAEVFKKYANKTLGIPEKQIRLLKNATAAQMKQSIAWLQQMAKVEKGKAKFFIYYSGHGLPDEETKEGYLIPVDVGANDVKSGISINALYKQLNECAIEKSVIIFDACFSGASRSAMPLFVRKNIRIAPKLDAPTGNLLVFSSSSKEESSGVFKEKQHGFFTYFLLKNLQETRGNTNMLDLYESVKQQVLKESSLSSKPQTPSLQISFDLKENSWNWNWAKL